MTTAIRPPVAGRWRSLLGGAVLTIALGLPSLSCSGRGAWDPGAHRSATLRREGDCGYWSVTFEDGPQFRASEPPPREWRDRPVEGTLTIESDTTATFAAEGLELPMFGSGTRDDVAFPLDCPADPP